jgi:N-methylhydantoinase B
MPETTSLDPVTVEVVRHKLDGIAEEMQQTLLRASFSPIVKEGLDASASLFTAEGETLAQACAIPIHLATLVPVLEAIRRHFPPETMREGDVYLLNDPYLGGTHLPDIALVMPVFHRGRLIAFSAAMTHHQDMGGMSPASLPTNATEIFQEGLRLPPLRFMEAGRENETLVAILRQNVRIPDTVMGDLRAQLSACLVGARRVRDLAEPLGGNLATAIFAELLDRAERLTRAALAALPAGTWRHADHLDDDGIDPDRPVRIEVAVTLGPGRFHCDFAGSAPQTRGPFNAVRSSVLAGVYFALRAVTDPDIPNNGGCYRVVSLSLPEASVVNPRPPAPVNARTATIKRIAGTILGALKDAIPDRVPADNAGALLAIMFGGQREDGSAFVTGELVTGGSGASARRDGVDVIETDATNCMNLPAEAMEMETPFRVHRVALREDSGGAGRHRGGLGLVKEYELVAEEAVLTHRGERHRFAPAGSQGGLPAERAHSVIMRADGRVEELPSKTMARLFRGDRVLVRTPGGGGYGPPAARDPAALAKDLADGKVGAEAARRLYGAAAAE